MKTVSIFNHVLGPVMRGPSSSHTAGAFHIGSMACSILGGTPNRAILSFDPGGSYAATYEPQGADRGFAMGLMNRPLTDESFFTALQDAHGVGMDLQYQVRPLPKAEHPNTTDLDLTSVDAVGGTARQACDAAAIGFQNTMGTVCDLLHGTVEIPCQMRNGAAAAAAFVNADLVLGGYTNFIPLDETIDAVYAVGRAMPPELRCTSKGGLAITPSAKNLTPRSCGSTCSTCH